MFVINRCPPQFLVFQPSALDRRTILCLYILGFQKQAFKHVPKCKWVPLTKFPWIPRANICNVIFVGILNLLRISQRAAIAGCSEFRKRSGFRKSERIQQIYADSAYLRGFSLQFADFTYSCGFRTAEIYWTHILLFAYGFHKLIRIPHVLLRIPQNCLFLEPFWTIQGFNCLSMESKTTNNIKKK